MKVIVICVAILLVAPLAMASETGGTRYPNIPYSEDLVNHWLNHSHNYSQTSKYKAPLGVGVDLTLYELDVKGLGLGFGVDSEYDMNNGVFGVFGKVKINTTGLINKLLGK